MKNIACLVSVPRLKVFTLLLALATAWNLSAGQAELASALGEARDELLRTRDQLQATVDALDALAKQKGGDMRPTYDTFVAEVSKTESAAAVTKQRARKMQADAGMHFGSWQKDIDTISNESLRKKAQSRFNDVQKRYDKVVASLNKASDRFTPFISDLNDIQKMLANDLTPGGVKAIRGTVSQAKWNLRSVRSAIFDASKELERMEKSLGTVAPK